jgi:hypothetical protein
MVRLLPAATGAPPAEANDYCFFPGRKVEIISWAVIMAVLVSASMRFRMTA